MPILRFLSLLLLLLTAIDAGAQTHAESEARMLELFKEEKFSEAIPYAIQAKTAAKKEHGDTSSLYILAISNLSFLYEKTGNYPPTETLYEELALIYKKKFGTGHPAYAVALNSQANAFYASGKLKQALPLYIQALTIQKKVYGMLHAEYWVIAKNLANTYFDLKDYPNAAIHFYDCLRIASSLKGEKSDEYAEALEAAAVVSNSISDLAKAKQYYTALAHFKKEKEGLSSTYAAVINILGLIFLDEANFAMAEQYLREAMEIRKKQLGEEHADYAQSVNNLGALYRKKGSYSTARRYYEEALAIRKKKGGEADREYGQTLNNLAELAQAEGNYALAESLMLKAVEIRKNADGEENEFYALNLNNLATLYSEMGKNEESETIHLKVLFIRKKILGDNHPEIAQSLNNLAIACENQGKKAAAEQYYTEALAIRKKIYGDQHPDYAQTLNNQGLLYASTGRYKEAEISLNTAAAIRKKMLGETHPDYLLTLDNLAALYINTNAYEKAESLLLQVLAGRKKVLGEDHADFGVSLNNLGALYCLTGRFEKGLALYQQVNAIYKKAWGEQHPAYALGLQNAAEIYSRLKNYKAAEPLFEEAIRIYQKSLGADHPSLATPLLGLASLQNNLGQYKNGEELLDSSNRIVLRHMQQNFINLGEEEKMQWWEDEANRFQMAPSLLLSNPHPSTWFREQTFLQQLQLKGYILKDGKKILEQIRKNGDPSLKKILGEWQANKATLARQYSLPAADRLPRLDSIERKTTEQEKWLNQQSVLFKRGNPDAGLSLDKIRKALQPGEAAIEFIRFAYYHQGWTDSVIYAAFVLLPGNVTPTFVALCEEKELGQILQVKGTSSEALIKQLYRGADIRNTNRQGNKADSLYRLIWKPLQPLLSGIKKIYLAPAGLLNRVAFNALAIDSSRYLIDEYVLHQLSTIGQIIEEAEAGTKDPSNTILLYGGIDFDVSGAAESGNKPTTKLPDPVQRSIRGGRWTSLPGTLEEIKTIQQLFEKSGKPVTTIKERAATEESLKQLSGHSPSILHLATHGFSLPDISKNREYRKGNQFSIAENPLMRSGVILAGANRVWNGGIPLPGKEDGIATAYEISGLDLGHTELVVLSACETALGDIRGTEGVFGLQRAFKLAGVKQMILSLWQVPDRETAELMSLFYTNKLGGQSTAAAFHAAQEEMRKKYPVYYWAAFTLLE